MGKIITTIYGSKEVEITFTIQSRTNKEKKPDPNEPLIGRYVSKVGNTSLIFNPTVSLMVRSGSNRDINAWIPLRQFYRFTSMLHNVYQSLNDEKLFLVDGQNTYVDRNRQVEKTRRLALFQSAVLISPCLVTTYGGTVMKGIEFLTDKAPIGSIPHAEVLGILEQLEHLDVTTYSLLAGITDELTSMSDKMDMILEKLNDSKSVAQLPPPPMETTQTIPTPAFGGLSWNTATNDWGLLS